MEIEEQEQPDQQPLDPKDPNPNFSDRAKEDFELVTAAQKGEQAAYGKLLSRYKDSIYFMVLKMIRNQDDADDLTMEAFGKAFNNLHKYSPEFAFSTWLYRIALNNCIDFIRKKRLNTMSLDQPFETDSGDDFTIEVRSHNLDPEEKYIKEQRSELMRDVIEKLNPRYKKLIEMRYFQELSYEEIAEELKIPLGTVKATLFRAKDLIYQILKNTIKHH